MKKDTYSIVAKSLFKLPCEEKDVATLYPNERRRAKELCYLTLYSAEPLVLGEYLRRNLPKHTKNNS